MTTKTLSRLLVACGCLVAVLAVLGLAIDYVPRLPRIASKIVLYKLAIGAGLGLMVGGAMIGRAARRSTRSGSPLR